MYGDQTIPYVTTTESPVHTDLPKPHSIYKAREKPYVKDERFSSSYCGFADSATVMCLPPVCWRQASKCGQGIHKSCAFHCSYHPKSALKTNSNNNTYIHFLKGVHFQMCIYLSPCPHFT